ncbi:MAG TPA: bifunctional 4-hydroxy-2-oxoglutarate aldolase/2-dehydro-3-deoxy-phosphogluconate aldolase [Polyangiaceae bacterium]|nr:bifunctional 4-hydroxy-2-oxoglutarate aldolase/2-dehydro-3-deoxy-phosphogluconate aldolase [Polyangiaceae bacterium]
MSRQDVCRRIEEVGVIPVVRAPSAELAVRAAEALVAGGLTVVELTLTVPDAVAVIRSLCARFAGRAVVGAGTVLSAEHATASVEAGAAFVVSPGLVTDAIGAAHAMGAVAVPGALTPTEVMSAVRAGADMVKIFPCSAVGGPKYIRALRAPLPDVKLVPTGGVTLATAAEYIAAGAAALGVGSELVDLAALSAGGDAVLAERASELAAVVRAAVSARSPSRASGASG